MKSIIVDDAEGNSESLKKLLRDNCPEVEVLAICKTVKEAIKAIKQHQPDIVFLDVQLEKETGFDLLEKCGDINFEVIFTTAHDQYAIKAIRFAALDYLLKPINIDELSAAIAKVEKKRNSHSSKQNMEVFLHNQKNNNSPLKKIGLPTMEGFTFVEISEIIRCEADAYYTVFILKNGNKIVVSRTLKEYDELLSNDRFFRVHQSHLINLHHINKYIKGAGGQVELSDKSVVPVAKRKKDELLKLLAID